VQLSSRVVAVVTLVLVAAQGCSTEPTGKRSDDGKLGNPIAGKDDGGPGDGFNAGNAGQPATQQMDGAVLPDAGALPECVPASELPDEFGRPACPEPDAGKASRDAGPRDGEDDDDGGSPPPTTTDRPCVLGGLCQALTFGDGGKLDLLFMVDDSGSMREEQVALRAQFPRMIRALTTGDLDDDGVVDFVPASDLHLGVVSSDMGIVGITGVGGCDGFGDDGILNDVGNRASDGALTCAASYPRFLSFETGVDDPTAVSNDFNCVATLGTDGCGFEQQLESVLKALTPASDPDIRFLGDINGFGLLGHGDVENAGFDRNDRVTGQSVLAIVLVTDEDDCSAADTTLFTPDIYLDASSPLYGTGLNLRCSQHPSYLYSLDRYYNGLRRLRAGNEALVVFGAIVGVPEDLVSSAAIGVVNWNDDASRDSFYSGILADPRMQEVADVVNDTLTPSCITGAGKAYPPRRIVELAQRFGPTSLVQSICQSDFAPAMDAIVRHVSRSLGNGCITGLQARQNGLIGCQVVFQLPLPGTPGTSVHQCANLPYLSPPNDRPAYTSTGAAVCFVDQVPVVSGPGGLEPSPGLLGWYYDDFSDAILTECTPFGIQQRIGFTAGTTLPAGVTAHLDCSR
jgi:hypothetical protein